MTGSSPGALSVAFAGISYADATFTVGGTHHASAAATFNPAPNCVNNSGAGGIVYSP